VNALAAFRGLFFERLVSFVSKAGQTLNLICDALEVP
jgi:hypothetical protein